MSIKLTTIAQRAIAIAALGALALTTGCGTGAGGAVVPTAASQQAVQAAAAGASVSFAVKIQNATRTTARHLAYVSPNTGSIAFTLSSVNGKATGGTDPTIAAISDSAPGCARSSSALTCTVAVPAPAGNDLFAVATYRSKTASGPILASATIAAVVTQGSKAKVAIDLNGVPASVSFSPARLPLVADGAVHRVPVVINAIDASGATIVGSSAYQSPVSLQIQNDPARALSLSTSSISGPGTTVTVTYDSSKPLVDGSIVASDNAMAPATLVAAPLTIAPLSVTTFAGAAPSTVTLSEAGFKGTFKVSLARRQDAAISVIPGTLGSGTAVVTVAPKASFDVTALDVSDGNLSVAVPVQIVPNNSTYAAFGPQHELLTPYAMIQGPNGNLWVSDPGTGSLVSFNPSSGTYTAHVVDPSLQGPLGIAFDAKGRLWFADGPQIGVYSPAKGAVTTYSTGLEPSANVTEMIAGPSGRIWFYDPATYASSVSGSPTYFGSIDPANDQITEYEAANGAGPTSGRMSMALAHDGSIWFADQLNAKIGRLDTSSGSISEYATGTPVYPQQSPMEVAVAADGKIWFVADGFTSSGSVIGSIDPAHPKAIAYDTNHPAAGIFYTLTGGPGGNLWFTQSAGSPEFYSDQLTLGVINRTTGALYGYPAAFAEFIKITALVAGDNSTLWMLDSGYGQIGKVTFK